jgi:hypothetical protein
MKRSIPFLLTLTLFAGALLAGQGAGTPAADPSSAFTVSGTVSAFTAAYGSGMPTLSVADAALGTVDVALGPVWFLDDAGFSAQPGDIVQLLAYTCPVCSTAAVAAWVENLTTGGYVELRDELGFPLWRGVGAKRGSGHGGGSGNGGSGEPGSGQGGPNGSGNQGEGGNGGGAGNGGNGETGHHGPGEPAGHGPGAGSGGYGPGEHFDWTGPDMAAAATVTGTVVEFAAVPGARMPTLILATDQGEIEILLSPYRVVAAAGLLLEPGVEVTVTYAPMSLDDSEVLVAISIIDPATGVTVQLRDPETGYPLAGGRRGGRWGH